MEECSCGKSYDSAAGVQLCMDNDHGTIRALGNSKYTFRHAIDSEFSVVCSRCNVPLKGYMRHIEGLFFEFNILPHICAVEDPQNSEERKVV